MHLKTDVPVIESRPRHSAASREHEVVPQLRSVLAFALRYVMSLGFTSQLLSLSKVAIVGSPEG